MTTVAADTRLRHVGVFTRWLQIGWMKPFAVVFLSTAVLYGLSPNVTNGDPYLSFPTAVSIVHTGDLTLDEFESEELRGHYALTLHDGAHFDYFPWTVALFFVPVVVAIDSAHLIGIGPGAVEIVELDQMGAFQLLAASIVTALAAALVAAVAWERSGLERRRRCAVAVAVGLVFGLGTSAWSTASRAMWQHGPSMLITSAALLVALRSERSSSRVPTFVVLGALAGLAFAVRPVNAVVLVAFAAWCAAKGWRAAVQFLWGGALVAAPWVAVNLATFGQVLPPYNSGSRVGWHDDLPEALAANLVSPSRGILVWAPVVLLAAVGLVVRRRDAKIDGLDRVAVASFVGYWVVVSGFKATWWAGHSIGPRFMTDTLPFLALLAVPAADRLIESRKANAVSRRRNGAIVAALLLAAWSIGVNAAAATLRPTNCWNEVPVNVDLDPSRVWAWPDAQVLSGPRAVLDEGLPAAVGGAACSGPSGVR